MRFRAWLLLLGLVFFLGCASDEIPPELEDPARVSGTVTYFQRIALPPDAAVRISLYVLARPEAPAVLVNEAMITDLSKVPIPFEIFYKRDTIDAHRYYAVQARIEAGGKTWFESSTPVQVITNGAYRDVQIYLDLVPH